jgi:succinylglutamic semialdehyde dehydrogenase
MKYQIKGNYFNGRYNPSSQKGPQGVEHFLTRESPADTSLQLWEMALDYNQIDELVHSSVEGFKFWRKLSTDERISFFKRYQEQVITKRELIAEAISLEMGKPLWEATGEVNSVIGKVDITINDSLPRVNDQSYDNIMPNTTGSVYFRPLGPCLIIGPFNFPCHLANTQILSALITGNSIVFKPSEKTAYSAQLLIDCFHEAGFPKGVISMAQGDGEIARRLVNDKRLKGVFFTGSKEVGLQILSNTSSDLSKMVALELGGKNPGIIHSDANPQLALEEILKASFMTSGQRCTSTSIVAIHETLIDEFVEKFHQLSKKIVVDHPIDFEHEPFMGPLVDQKALDSYLLFMGMAKREGFEEIMRGKHLTNKTTQGHYVSPSIHLAKAWDDKSHFLSSEIFGPNCTFIPYKEIEEAIHIANATEYGLAAGVFTGNQSVFDKCIEEIDAGLINLNRSTCGASPKLPFGGLKNSGNYRPAAVAMIDSCVLQKASLQVSNSEPLGLDAIKGLKN